MIITKHVLLLWSWNNLPQPSACRRYQYIFQGLGFCIFIINWQSIYTEYWCTCNFQSLMRRIDWCRIPVRSYRRVKLWAPWDHGNTLLLVLWERKVLQWLLNTRSGGRVTGTIQSRDDYQELYDNDNDSRLDDDYEVLCQTLENLLEDITACDVQVSSELGFPHKN